MKSKKPDFWQTKEGADYMVRELSHGQYEVTKWTRGDTPAKIYTVYERGKNKWACNCPSRGECKHIKLVKNWIKKGKKPFYDISDLPKLVKKYLK